jgi:hypothetical protein
MPKPLTPDEPLPVAYYLWLATIERDVRVRDLTADEVAGLIAALRSDGDAELLRDIRAALAPFGNTELIEQILPDEDDEEWAKFRLLIGDYRRAHAALTRVDARLATKGGQDD